MVETCSFVAATRLVIPPAPPPTPHVRRHSHTPLHDQSVVVVVDDDETDDELLVVMGSPSSMVVMDPIRVREGTDSTFHLHLVRFLDGPDNTSDGRVDVVE